MFKKVSVFSLRFVLALTLLSLLALVSSSCTNNVDKARESYNRSDYESAEKALKDEERTPEVSNLLGMINLKSGHPYEAMTHFRVAIAGDALDNDRLNESIEYISLSELKKIQGILFDVSAKNENFKQELLTALQSKAKNSIRDGNCSDGINSYRLAIKFDQAVRDDAYSTFTTIAERSGIASQKVNAYNQALEFKPGKKKEVGILLANLAVDLWPSGNAKVYRKSAAKLLPKTMIEEAFPCEKIKIITLGPFTKKNVNEKGYVTVFSSGKGKIKKGDTLEVVATMMDGKPYLGSLVMVARNKKWKPLKDGRDHCLIDRIDGGFYVLIKEEKDVKFIVNIVRKYTPKPQKI